MAAPGGSLPSLSSQSPAGDRMEAYEVMIPTGLGDWSIPADVAIRVGRLPYRDKILIKHQDEPFRDKKIAKLSPHRCAARAEDWLHGVLGLTFMDGTAGVLWRCYRSKTGEEPVVPYVNLQGPYKPPFRDPTPEQLLQKGNIVGSTWHDT